MGIKENEGIHQGSRTNGARVTCGTSLQHVIYARFSYFTRIIKTVHLSLALGYEYPLCSPFEFIDFFILLRIFLSKFVWTGEREQVLTHRLVLRPSTSAH